MSPSMRRCAGAIAPRGPEKTKPASSRWTVHLASSRNSRPYCRFALSDLAPLTDVEGGLRYRGAHGANRISDKHAPLAKRHSSNSTFEHPAV